MAAPHYSTVEVKVGLFAAFCAALFVAMLASYGRVVPVWRGRQEILVAFDDVGSLRLDAPVRYNGVEVGRVKWMRILHLDEDAIACLPPLARSNLDDLPIRPDALKRDLRAVGEEDFPARCRQALKNRTMIQLCLEVLQEGDDKRYRLDDRVRVVTTVLGDTAVEIMSGSGAVNLAGSKQMLLGTSGDFFSNLAKSMGEVKGILSSVTDVVGTPERRSFERAQARFGPINERLDQITGLSQRRADATLKRVDGLSADLKKTLADAGALPDKLRPQAQTTADNVRSSFTAIQDRFNEVQTQVNAVSDELSADFKPVREDVKNALDKSRPEFDETRTRLRTVYDLMGGLSRRTDAARDTTGALYTQSEPDLTRTVDALKNSLVNLDYTNQAANENKDLMLSSHDSGEYEYNTALDIYRRFCFATRRIRDAGAQLDDTARLASSRMPLEASALAPDTATALARLAATRGPLDTVHQKIEELMLPPFKRKKAAWTDDTAAAK